MTPPACDPRPGPAGAPIGDEVPRVSVVIPAYNARDHIAESIRSALTQTFRDHEILVVDDGSTDGTYEYVRRHFPEVRAVRVANGGVARARNLGVEQARGDLIAFLDSDDLWLPTKLEKQVARFEERPELGMVFTESVAFNEQGFRPNPFSKRERLMRGDLVRNIFLFSYVGTPTVMLRKAVFIEVGGFVEELSAAEDDNLWMRVAHRYPVDLLDEVLVHVRVRPGSVTTTDGVLFRGLNEHVALIRRDFPELLNRIGRLAIRRRLASNYHMRGCSLFRRGRTREARHHLSRALWLHPTRSTVLYLLASLLPEGAVAGVRAVKRKIT